jgi:2-polyprenyl-6-hydroxyphenyl methylase/3-demethylubiquinone-9 3-methyltransferase
MTDLLRLFRGLPLLDRFHLRVRLASCPFEAVVAELPERGTIGEVGCGHGLLCALAATAPDRKIVGVDPDERKIALGRSCLASLPKVELHVGTASDLPRDLDAIAICDVLYLLPKERWREILAACRDRLRRGGRLVIKEADVVPAWKWHKAMLQERIMVTLLRRTKTSGGLHFQPRAETETLLRSIGFQVEATRDLGRGYSTAHVLFVATRL